MKKFNVAKPTLEWPVDFARTPPALYLLEEPVPRFSPRMLRQTRTHWWLGYGGFPGDQPFPGACTRPLHVGSGSCRRISRSIRDTVSLTCLRRRPFSCHGILLTSRRRLPARCRQPASSVDGCTDELRGMGRLALRRFLSTGQSSFSEQAGNGLPRNVIWRVRRA